MYIKRRIAGIVLYCWLGLVLAACGPADLFGGTNEPPAATITGPLALDAPAQAQVGEPVQVRVGPVSAPDGTTVTFMALGSYGPRIIHAPLAAGFVTFNVESEATRRSGTMTLVATVGNARGTAELTLQPGPPVGPLTPLVGSRSIPVGGEHWSMAVVVPFDRLDNPVADGTPITFRAQHPDGSLEEKVVPTRHLLAWERIYSGTEAGTTRIAVSAAGAHGPEETLLEFATLPVSITLTAEPPTLPANGQDLMMLRTDTLRDQLGNVLPDGTLVTFVVEEPDREPRRIPAYTVAGRAEVPLQAPAQPGAATVRAVIENVTSESLVVTFTPGPAINTFPVTADVDVTTGGLLLTAGPLLGQLEQYVPDGTPVRLSVIPANGERQEYTAITAKGHATLELRLAQLTRGSYTVEATAGAGRGSTEFTIPAE